MQRPRHFRFVVMAALLTIALVAGAASAGHAATPTLSFTLTGSPPAVTPGLSIGYTGQITNTGAQTLSSLSVRPGRRMAIGSGVSSVGIGGIR